MRLLSGFGKNLVINEEISETVDASPASPTTTTTVSCYRRTCAKCKELLLPTAVADALNLTDDHIDMQPTGRFLRINTVEVHPVMVRKTPKFPTRERHLAIKRKKSLPPSTSSSSLDADRSPPPSLGDAVAADGDGEKCKNCSESGK